MKWIIIYFIYFILKKTLILRDSIKRKLQRNLAIRTLGRRTQNVWKSRGVHKREFEQKIRKKLKFSLIEIFGLANEITSQNHIFLMSYSLSNSKNSKINWFTKFLSTYYKKKYRKPSHNAPGKLSRVKANIPGNLSLIKLIFSHNETFFSSPLINFYVKIGRFF